MLKSLLTKNVQNKNNCNLEGKPLSFEIKSYEIGCEISVSFKNETNFKRKCYVLLILSFSNILCVLVQALNVLYCILFYFVIMYCLYKNLYSVKKGLCLNFFFFYIFYIYFRKSPRHSKLRLSN